MKILSGILKLLAGIFLSLLLISMLAIGFLYYELRKPEVTIPEKALRWAAEEILRRFDYDVSFKTMALSIYRLDSFYERQIILRSTDLKVVKKDLLKTEIPELDLELEVNIHPKTYGISSIGPIDVHGATLALQLPAPDPRAPDEAFQLDPIWFERARKTRFEPIRLGLKDFTLERPNEPKIQAQIYVNLQKLTPRRWALGGRFDRVKGLPIRQGSLDVTLNLAEGNTFLPLSAVLKAQANLIKLGKMQVSSDLQMQAEDKAQFRLDLVSNIGSQRQLLKASGQLDQERFGLKVSGSAANPLDMLRLVEVNSCEWSGNLKQKAKPFLQSNFNCSVALTRVPAPVEEPFQDMLPSRVQFSIKGPVSIANWDKNPSFNAPLSIALTPLRSAYYTLRSSTLVKINGRVFGGLKELNAVVEADSQISLDRFQPLVKRLSPTEFSIPAPFNTLDGRIYCDFQGRISRLGETIHLPMKCATELASETQSLFVTAEGLIEKKSDKKPLIRLNIGLNKVTFELPKLALNGKVPQIFPDKRISKADERVDTGGQPTPLPVVLDIHITTPPERPLTLVTTLAKQPIPISFDVFLKGDIVKPTGSIAIEQYNVAFLKKKAFVHHLRLLLVEDEPQPRLDGLVEFNDPDVKISLKLSGAINRPFYILESQPPRAPTELLSMILFGGNAEALDDESLRSVEETRAAMVDGAIGLLSMYYLASTPIDSVGYNPHTGLFRARLRVGPGLSLMVGSDLEGARQSIALRKRLTENWSFETGAETDEETKENRGVAMFKWGRRY